jgi:hypothetical protein
MLINVGGIRDVFVVEEQSDMDLAQRMWNLCRTERRNETKQSEEQARVNPYTNSLVV